jgi:hypothetical protein
VYLPVSRRDFLRAAVLALVAALTWIAWQGAWTRQAWESPAAYSVDALEYLARLRIASERGTTFLFDETVPRLGAPWTADWSAYPMPDRPINVATGWATRATDLIVAGNLSLLAAHVLAALGFFAGARMLGHRPWIAAAGALVFAFSYYVAQRGFSHYSFALAFVVPLMLALTLTAAGARNLFSRRSWQIGGAAIAVLVALGNPYFGFVFGQLLLLALLARIALHRGRGAAVILGWLGIFLVVLMLANLHAVRALFAGSGAVMDRNYAGTEIYGLRPIEFFIPPPTHRWSFFAEIGRRYAAATSLKGELFFPYLGLVGIAGFVLLASDGIRRLVRGNLSLRPAYLPLAAWLVLLAMVGGAAAAFAFGVSDLFRATNRYSIFVLALVLFFLTSRASRCVARKNFVLILAATIALVALALWDQLPPRSPDRAELHAQVEADRALAAQLEAALPAGAMIFQLPAVPFLEQPPVGAMTDYELFRPFLFTRTLRFSYGPLAGTPEIIWQQNVARLPVPEMLAALERAGFAAIAVRRDAFPDRAAALERALSSAGRARLLEAGNQLVFRLQPVEAPKIPDLDDPLRHARWDDRGTAPGEPAVLLGGGWFPLEHDGSRSWRWAGSRASLWLFNASTRAVTAHLEFTLTTTTSTRVTFAVGNSAKTIASTASQPHPVIVDFALPPGLNELRATSDGATRRSATDPRRLGFNLGDLRADFRPAAE